MRVKDQSFEERFKAYLTELLPGPSQSFIVGLSGGVDSMVLLHLLHQNGHRLWPVHVQYHLRGDDSLQDEALVRGVCASLGLDLKVVQADLSGQKHGVQLKARQLRYTAFEQLREEKRAQWLATGHHLDDALETLWLNLSRGTGLSGLKGIPARDGHKIRPLRFATAEEIQQFALQKQLAWREDKSNADPKYKRNRIRHKLLPMLKELNPSWPQSFERSLSKLETSLNIQKQWLHERRNRLMHQDPETGDYRMLFLEMAAAGVDPHVLSWLLEPYGFTEAQGRLAWELIGAAPGKRLVSSQFELIAEKHALVLQERAKALLSDWSFNAQEDFHQGLPPGYILDSLGSQEPSLRVYPLPHDWEKKGLEFGRWKSGDKMTIRNGRKKVSDLLNEAGLRGERKMNQAVWRLGEEVVWIPGIRKSWHNIPMEKGVCLVYLGYEP